MSTSSNRLNPRALVVGSAVVFTFMLLWQALLSAASGGMLTMEAFRRGEPNAWFWLFAGWVIAVFLGARLATVAAKSARVRDALMNSIGVWAVSSVVGYFMLLTGGWSISDAAEMGSSASVLWIGFIGSAAAFFGAVFSGRIEARHEAKAERREARSG